MLRPNILLLVADQFRSDAVGCIGGYARTPNIDALAARGVLFENAYANSAECVPSRMSLATGLYPHHFGVDRNATCTLNPAFQNWMQAVQAAGYRTSVFGKTHLHPHQGDLRDRQGLLHEYGLETVDETCGPRALAGVKCNLTDLWQERGVWQSYRDDLADRFATKPYLARPSPLPLDLYYDVYVGRAACRYLRSLDAAAGAPWFCWVSFGGPHEPWDAPEPYASMYAPAAMPKPRPRRQNPEELAGLLRLAYASRDHSPRGLGPEDIAALRANYAGNVTLIDDVIGEILDTLDKRGELQRTTVIFTSDHGEMNGDEGLIYKANFLDASIKVPLIIAPSSTEPVRAVRSEALVELMDVGATIVDYADGERPRHSAARSLRHVVEGDAGHRDFCVCEFSGHSCVVTSKHKVELSVEMEATAVFDREMDGCETTDQRRNPKFHHAISEAREILMRHRAKTDPLVNVAPIVLESVQ